MTDKELGTVKWFDAKKGYGFIVRDQGGEVFVHYRSIHGDGFRKLNEGQRVEFAVGETEHGTQAQDVGLVE